MSNRKQQLPSPFPSALAPSENRVGRHPDGATAAYPEMSRTKLAAATGKHISTVTGMLNGRSAPKLGDAITIAREMGVTIEELDRELAGRREAYRRAKTDKTAKTAKTQKRTRGKRA